MHVTGKKITLTLLIMVLALYLGVKPFRFQVRQIKASILSKLPISSKYFGPPKSMQSYSLLTAAEHGICAITPYMNGGSYTPKDPLLHKELGTLSVLNSELLCLKQARIYGQEGVVITKGDCALTETCLYYGRQRAQHPVFAKLTLGKVQHYSGSVGSALTRSHNYYFHWMLEVLPKIIMLQECCEPSSKILIGSLSQPFQFKSLQLLGIDLERIIEVEKKAHIEADTLIYPHIPNEGALRPLWAKEKILPYFNLPPELPQNKKIFISRSLANSRRIQNEEEIYQILAPQGYELVHLEELSLRDQALLFFQASHIIAPHGGGLTNLIFSRPGTRILEINHIEYRNSWFSLLCDQWNIEYSQFITSTKSLKGEKQPHPPHPHDLFMPVHVITEQLAQWAAAP